MDAAYTTLREEIGAGTLSKGTETKHLEPIPSNGRSPKYNFPSRNDTQHWWGRICRSCNRPAPAGSSKLPSPHCTTDYIRRAENDSCFASAIRLLNYYRAKRYFKKL